MGNNSFDITIHKDTIFFLKYNFFSYFSENFLRMKILDILSSITEIAPLEWQEPYDNAGLIVGNPDDEVNKALVTLDVTDEVLEEAINGGFDIIIAHHPLIFKGLKRINDDDPVSRLVKKAVMNNIAVAAMHTNLDNSPIGVSACLGTRLGLSETKILKPIDGSSEAGAGIIGTLPSPLSEKDFLSLIHNVLGTVAVRHSAPTGKKISKVALCGGSGAFLIDDAKAAKADAFVTADVKYHDFAAADGRILLVDAGHFETEQFIKDFIAVRISEKNRNFAVSISNVKTNYIHYFV